LSHSGSTCSVDYMLKPSPSSPPQAPQRLLSVESVRRTFSLHHPYYGQSFSEADWDRITARLEALARLLWRISCRLAGETPASSLGRTKDWSRSSPKARKASPTPQPHRNEDTVFPG